jgi:hypothetical protein
MLRSRVLGLSVAATLAVSAVASNAAQAVAPEWRQNGLSLTKLVAFNFKGAFGKIIIGASELTWTGVSGSGTIEAPNKVTLAKLIFTGSKIGTCSVNSLGAKPGELITSELKGQLGYLKEATKQVGILFAGATELFLEVPESACIPLKITFTGSVIGSITPVNFETTKLIASFNLVGGVNEFTKFEGEAEEHVLRYHEGATEGLAPFECKEEELATAELVEIKG